MKDFSLLFAVLGGKYDIDKRFREFAKKYHPDKNPETADFFKTISELYNEYKRELNKKIEEKTVNVTFNLSDLLFNEYLKITSDIKISSKELLKSSSPIIRKIPFTEEVIFINFALKEDEGLKLLNGKIVKNIKIPFEVLKNGGKVKYKIKKTFISEIPANFNPQNFLLVKEFKNPLYLRLIPVF